MALDTAIPYLIGELVDSVNLRKLMAVVGEDFVFVDVQGLLLVAAH